MKFKIIFFVFVLLVSLNVFSQITTIELTFTATNNGAYVRLDSIKVLDRKYGDYEMLYWPDTTLTHEIIPGNPLYFLYIGYSTGFPVSVRESDPEKIEFRLHQSYPNPVSDRGFFSLYLPEKGIVNINITDIQGRVIHTTEWWLDKGDHSFHFTPCKGALFLLTARWDNISRSIKILTTGRATANRFTLYYSGGESRETNMKEKPLFKADPVMQESGILDSVSTDKSYIFQFATNIPCPGIPSVEYGGQVYNTVQIFSQCWFKENLNIGTMIPADEEMTDNGTIEKYCYDNDMDNCTVYGGLYQWDEMMQYTIQAGAQGICPPDWHVPDHADWKVLEGAVDSQYGMDDYIWDYMEYRGYDAGTNLKTTSEWYGTGTDLFGFSGLPGGNSNWDGTFHYLHNIGNWWTSLECPNIVRAYHRSFGYFYPGVRLFYDFKETGFSVRCLRDWE